MPRKTSLPLEVIRRHKIYPEKEDAKTIHLLSAESLSTDLIKEFEFLSSKKIKLVNQGKVTERDILDKISDDFGLTEGISEIIPDAGPALEAAPDKPDENIIKSTQVKVLDIILHDAVKHNASDIHLERFENRVRVRTRVDGVLYDRETFPLDIYDNVISRIKIISSLNIGEKRLPQDGKFLFENDGKSYDIRVSIVPAYFGEACVLRVLHRESRLLDLAQLGFSPDAVALLNKYANLPNGLILINGPTGSGKTTTLYSILNLINTTEKKVITIEDPIEYFFDKILQMQVKPQIGFDFSAGLRSILRHDPEIILVGEIRDNETAEIALRSAITGHLVFSTVHTNDNASTILRLVNLGVDKYIISQGLKLLVTQRLIRKVCQKCGTDTQDGFIGKGCRDCGNTGYKGREVIYETLEVDDALRDLIMTQNVSRTDIQKHLKKK